MTLLSAHDELTWKCPWNRGRTPYDANSDVTSDVIARGGDVGKSQTFVYDGLGRVYQAKGANGQVLTYAYDGNGNVLSVSDALGHVMTYAYDALNRVEGVMDAAGGVTSYTYDAGDHVTRVTDPRGLVTTYSYDGLGQLWTQVSPDTGATTFTYDANSRLTGETRNSGNRIAYAYDAINRVVSVAATNTLGTITRSFTWDTCPNGIGRLCSAAHVNDDTIGYSYTPEGWIAARNFSFVSGINYALSYSYDNMGHLASVTYPDGNQALYDYSLGAVADVRLKIGTANSYAATSVVYRPMDLAMSSWISSNGLANGISYDTDLRPTSIAASGAQSLAFTYDAANRINHIANGMDGTLTQTYTYDAMSRLTGVTSTADNESFAYDADGNRTLHVWNGSNITFTMDVGSNRLISTSNGSGSTTYGYDADGNTLTANGSTLYGYGGFGLVTGANGYMSYANGAEGQRLRNTNTVARTQTYFAPDRSGVPLAEDQAGLWLDYVYLNGRLVSVVRSGQVYAVHTDQTGRPLVLTDASKAVVWEAENLPYPISGYVMVNTFGTFNLGYPGQYQDPGIIHNGVRDYNAYLGRYVESDPIGLAGGINTYAYVGNNPISNVDPLGLKCGCNQGQPTGGQNNVGQPASGLNMNDWSFAQELSAGNSATVDSTGGIAIQAGGTAGPLGTDQFGYFVTQRPLALNGGYESIAAPMNWGNPTYYSSGFVGSGGTNTMIFSAMQGAGGNRWFINFPAQESTHGNASNEYLDIYVPRCN